MAKMHNYNNMPHRFDPLSLLVQVLSHKGLYYPGIWIPWLSPIQRVADGGNYSTMPNGHQLNTYTANGTPIRKSDIVTGRVYFMPVWINSSLGKLEIPAAAVSIKGKKNIVETALTGRRGSVKELISVDDYEVSLHGVLVSDDNNYPEEMVQLFRDLYELNEAVELISALSDLVLNPDDKIVIKSVDYPKVGAVENAQVVSFTAVTDSAIELIIE